MTVSTVQIGSDGTCGSLTRESAAQTSSLYYWDRKLTAAGGSVTMDENEKEQDLSASLLPADPSAAVTTETLPNSVRRGEHGKDCIKVAHWRHGAFLHPEDHDGPYEIDSVKYCGRCHAWMGTQVVVIERVGSGTQSLSEASASAGRSESVQDTLHVGTLLYLKSIGTPMFGGYCVDLEGVLKELESADGGDR